jgi:UDP-glucuronate decarboxylase
MIRWIIPNKLGTAPFGSFDHNENFTILDVRDLLDRAGNTYESVGNKIQEGNTLLYEEKPLIICCDYGISRSNAIAAGILAKYKNKSLSEAIRNVIAATGEKEIKIEILDAVRYALCEKKSKHSNKAEKRLLITGGSGFVGQNLIKNLKNKYCLYTPRREEIDLLSGSVELDIFSKEKGITHLIHLASPRVSLSNKSIGMTLTVLHNILDVCINNNIKLIYPSSWVIYSNYRSEALVADEKLFPNPFGPYAETKWLADMLLNLFRNKYNLQCALLRPCSLYGEDSDRPKFLWSFIDSAAKSLPITVHNYINGIPSIDLLHVKDFCKALRYVIDTDFIGDINLGCGRLLSIKDIASIICNILHSNSDILSVPINDYTANIIMGTTYANKVFGWQPSVLFEDGIKELIGKRIG